ncbi:MAG: D-sedoheptulose 7-phosphate isomerase [Candidatus Moranbacteria bacterium]|nr:D-sedoheptulose 7-phosphate isomerase [Candidatus Moranbacteria bacterium]
MKNKLQKASALIDALQDNEEFLSSLNSAKDEIIKSLENKGKLMACGNGGSATQASHMVGEFVGRFAFDRPALPAISLFDLATTTAVGNDYGYDDIFSRFVDSLGNNNDILFSISTSGNSGNCLKAMESAKKKNIKNITLLGKDGGKMKELSDMAIVVPDSNTPLIQEIHLMVIHWLCEEVEKHFFEK